MTSALAAVGMSLGAISIEDPLAIGPAMVAVGSQLIQMTVPTFVVWSAGQDPRPEAPICDWARSMGVDEPAPILRELVEAGFLAALPSPDEMTEWSARYRLVPQGRGIGNRSDNPVDCVIGDRDGKQVIAVDVGTYYVWALSAGSASLATAISATVDSTDIPSTWLAGRIANVLPELLRWQVVYLDLS